MNVLVIAAHPDDEVLGAGATIARYSQRGTLVDILILGEGITSRVNSGDALQSEGLIQLQDEAFKAAKVMGARPPKMEGLPDNKFDTVPLLHIAQIIEAEIDRVKPEVIYTHHPSDLNIDHRITFQAVLTATRTMAGTCVKRLYSFEIPSSTEWSFGQFEPPFRPTTFVDVSSTIEAKLRAMACYQGEMRSYPHPRSLEALKIIAQRWGTVAGFRAAEAFQLIRAIHPEGTEE